MLDHCIACWICIVDIIQYFILCILTLEEKKKLKLPIALEMRQVQYLLNCRTILPNIVDNSKYSLATAGLD